MPAMQWLQEAVAELDALQPALAALAERRCAPANRCGCASAVNPVCQWM